MKMSEMVSASNIIYEEAGENSNVIFGCVADERLNENQEIHVTVVATGINASDSSKDSAPIYNMHNQTTNYFDHKNQDNIEDSSKNEKSESENNQLFIEKEKEDVENANLTFGEDDLEVPAFMREQK